MHISLDGFVCGPNGEMNWIKINDEIFNHVENMKLDQANSLSLILLLISFVVILWINRKNNYRVIS